MATTQEDIHYQVLLGQKTKQKRTKQRTHVQQTFSYQDLQTPELPYHLILFSWELMSLLLVLDPAGLSNNNSSF